MNNLWQKITEDLGLTRFVESSIHPHIPEERADLFHAHDNGATEFEFLNLLHALVLATKPLLVLETGTFTGLGTLAIASALEWNGVGRLVTLDIDSCETARELVKRYDLDRRAFCLQIDASEFIRSVVSEKFDFAFIDSGGERLQEINLLHDLGRMNPGAPIILHDASPHRHESMPNATGETNADLIAKHCKLSGHTIPLSRGLRLMFAPNL